MLCIFPLVRRVRHLVVLLTVLLIFLCSAPAGAQGARAKKDAATGLYGYADIHTDEWVISPSFIFAKPFEQRLAIVKKRVGSETFTCAINKRGEIVSPYFRELNFDDWADIYYGQGVDGTWRLYRADFNPVGAGLYESIAPMYGINDAYVFLVSKNGLMGTIDYTGHAIIPTRYTSLKHLNDIREKELKEFMRDKSYYKVVSKAYKDGIGLETSFGCLVARNPEGKWGIVSCNNHVVAPFEYDSVDALKKNIKKVYEEHIYNFLINEGGKEGMAEWSQQLKDELPKSTFKYITLMRSYPDEFSYVAKAEMVEMEGGYALAVEGKAVTDVCEEIIDLGRTYLTYADGKYGIYSQYGIQLLPMAYDGVDVWDGGNLLVYKDGKCGICDRYGRQLLPVEYDGIDTWNEDSESNILLAERQGKYVLVNKAGIKLTKEYDYISFASEKAGVGIAYDSSGFWLVGKNGRIVSRKGYDAMEIVERTTLQIAEVSLYGYTTTLDATGKEDNPICHQLIVEANALPYDRAQEMYDKYMLCAEIDRNNQDDYQRMAYYNIGVLFDRMGDTNNALTYYEKAKALGDKDAKRRVSEIKTMAVLETIQQIAADIQQIAINVEAIRTGGSGGGAYTSGAGTGAYAGGSSIGSGGGSGNYAKQYAMYEHNAENFYRTLTNLGTRSNKNGQRSGTSGGVGHVNGSNYVSMKKNLRHAQSEMRRIRMAAQKAGVNIPQSQWETATVSY